MRKAVVLALALALLAASSSSLAAGAASGKKAQLRVVAMRPVGVQGLNFKARELVRITLRVNTTMRLKQVRANVSGRFTATFDGVEVGDRCSSDLWAAAVGRRGSVAIAKMPMLQCPPRGGPPTP